MASNKVSATILVFSLLAYSTFTEANPTPCPPTPPAPTPTQEKCPKDTLKLGVCADLLGLVNVVIGDPPSGSPCCTFLKGLADLEAAVCLCTAIKGNVLGSDIAFCVGIISRVMDKPKSSHLMAAKRIMRYLKGTSSYGVLFPSENCRKLTELHGYTDADWCGDKNDRKSTAGFVFFAGTAPISWCSKKENVVALSSCEAEYIAAAMGACQAVWLNTLMQELKMKKESAVELFVDNKSAINLAKFPVAHGRCKHIETRYHFLRDQVTKGTLKLSYCRSEDQCADIFTKSLKKDSFKKLRNSLNLVDCNKLD